MFVGDIAPVDTGSERDALDVLLDDPEWIAAEFAAIMAAAGVMRDVRTAERPPDPPAGASGAPDATQARARRRGPVVTPSVARRVRSPPA